MGMDEASALVRALCSSHVDHMSLVCSMCQCLNILVVYGHVRGMRFGTCLVCAACAVAIVVCVTSDGLCCPKLLNVRKQDAYTI